MKDMRCWVQVSSMFNGLRTEVMEEDVIFRKYALKYLGVKGYDVCNSLKCPNILETTDKVRQNVKYVNNR